VNDDGLWEVVRDVEVAGTPLRAGDLLVPDEGAQLMRLVRTLPASMTAALLLAIHAGAIAPHRPGAPAARATPSAQPARVLSLRRG
jgi:hypothetical protein